MLACIYRKEGMSITDIAKTLNTPRTNVDRWLSTIALHGLSSRYDIKNKGAKCKLDSKQMTRLVLDLDAGPAAANMGANMWTVPLITKHIKRKFGVDYNTHSVWEMVCRRGFSYKLPRPANPKAANRRERRAFKKKAAKLAAAYRKAGYTVFVADEMHLVLNGAVKMGWFREDERPVVEINSRKGRISIIGAIGESGGGSFMFYKTANAPNMIKFLVQLHKRFGKVLVFMDNAAYHSKFMLEEVGHLTGGEVAVKFLPKYTPELNPIETQWVVIRRHIGNSWFDNVDDARRTIRNGLRRKLIPIVKLHDYLLP